MYNEVNEQILCCNFLIGRSQCSPYVYKMVPICRHITFGSDHGEGGIRRAKHKILNETQYIQCKFGIKRFLPN